jgi:hypothetical protein
MYNMWRVEVEPEYEWAYESSLKEKRKSAKVLRWFPLKPRL